MSYQLTTGDAGKILAFPLLQADGSPNDFTGATANLMVRDQSGMMQPGRAMVWNSITNEWEYSVRSGEFTEGRYWAMVAVSFPGNVVIYSSEVVFDVVSVD